MSGGLKACRLIKRADVEMRFFDSGKGFASQCRPAAGAEPASGLARSGIEFGYLAFGNRVSVGFERDEDRNRRTSMPSTTLAVAPIDALGSAGRCKTDRTAKTSAFKLLRRAAHDRSCARLRIAGRITDETGGEGGIRTLGTR